MKTYKVITEFTAVTEYMVRAEDAEQAEEKFLDGQYIDEKITGYQDENITEIGQEVTE